MSIALPGRSETAARWAAVALGASIPVSVALDNILAVLILLLSVAALRFRERLGPALGNPVALAALALLTWLAAGLAWGSRPRADGWSTLVKYGDLLLVPLLLPLFSHPDARRMGLLAFSAAIAVTLALSFARLGGLPLPAWLARGTLVSPIIFKLSITHSLLVAYGAYLFALLARRAAGRARLVWAALALAAATNALLVPGRTGYVVLLGLTALFLLGFAGRRGVLTAAVAVSILAGGAWVGSDTLRGRVELAAAQALRWDPGRPAEYADSVGSRLEFYHETVALIAARPLLGVGTGGFPGAYAERVAGTGRYATENPHNEYLMLAAQVGIPGALLLIALFVCQWRSAAHLPSALERDLARGLVWTFAAGSLFNSMLLDHTEGMLFAWFSGLLFAGLRSNAGAGAVPLPEASQGGSANS